MAISESNISQYDGKITWLLIFSCTVAATGGLLFGYDAAVTGGVTTMEPFLKKFFPQIQEQQSEEETSNYCRFDSQLLTSFCSSIYITGLSASLFASRVTRLYGRGRSIALGGSAFLVGTAIGAAAQNIYVLLIGRLFLGVGIGFANQAAPLYLSEMAPPDYRGAFNYSFQFFVSVGAVAAYVINYFTGSMRSDWGWRISLAAAAIPSLVLTIGSMFLPETPNSLIQLGLDQDKAKRVLQRIRGVDNVDAEMDDLIEASQNCAKLNHPFKKLLKREYRAYVVMSIAIPFFQQVTGINVITFYAPIIFRTIGYDEQTSLMAVMVIEVMGTAMVLLSSFVVDRFGRRFIFQVGGIVMFVAHMIIGGIMAAKLGEHGSLPIAYSNIVAVLICVYVLAFAFSWGPLAWLVSSEIYPLEIRSAAQSISVAVCFLTSFVVGQTFLAMLCEMKYGTFFFYGGWVWVMTCFVWFLLPETRNIPIEKMDIVWKNHGFWNRFASQTGIHHPLL